MTFKHSLLAALGIASAGLAILAFMGRPPICTCGTVELWHGAIDAGNSQHIFDWYSPSHFIHGLLFFAGLRWLLRRRSVPERYVAAVAIETLWEIAENSPFIIDRYRTATIALGYTGDSMINSVSDILAMSLGFCFARIMPVWLSILLTVALECLTLIIIRDNLTLNIIMLLYPIAAIKQWQAAL